MPDVPSVSIDNIDYPLSVIPDGKTKIVEEERHAILGNLQLEDIIIGLNNASVFIYLAYNGVAGFGTLRASLIDLHDRFGGICRDSDVALLDFSEQSKKVQAILIS